MSFAGLSDAGETVTDLYIDSQALTDFAGQLKGLLADFSDPITSSSGGWCDASLFDQLASLTSTDGACGKSLNNYLTALARLADQAAQAAEVLDAGLANEVPSHVHGSRIMEGF